MTFTLRARLTAQSSSEQLFLSPQSSARVWGSWRAIVLRVKMKDAHSTGFEIHGAHRWLSRNDFRFGGRHAELWPMAI